jgi:hypothetical protein
MGDDRLALASGSRFPGISTYRSCWKLPAPSAGMGRPVMSGGSGSSMVRSKKPSSLPPKLMRHLAYTHDRQFAVSLSGIRTLPHQIRSKPFTRRCCRSHGCASFSLTIRAPVKRSWPAYSLSAGIPCSVASKSASNFAEVCRHYLEKSFKVRINRAQERAMMLAADGEVQVKRIEVKGPRARTADAADHQRLVQGEANG